MGNAPVHLLHSTDPPLGVDVLMHTWERVLLCVCLVRVREYGQQRLAEIYLLMCASPWQLLLPWDLLSQGVTCSIWCYGLGPWVVLLDDCRAPAWMIFTIKKQASSTRCLYGCKGRVIKHQCHRNGCIPFWWQAEGLLYGLCVLCSCRPCGVRESACKHHPHKAKLEKRQHLWHWVVEAIPKAYSSQGFVVPGGLYVHSTWGVTTSWALFTEVSVQDICAAVSWSSLLAFVYYYMLDGSIRLWFCCPD